MRKCYKILLCLILFLMTGCAAEVYHIDKQEKKEIKTEANAYMLAGRSIKTIEKSRYEKADVVYYAKNEDDLVRILQYAINHKKKTVSYQSEKDIDLEKVANLLSYLNPYDISLTLSTVDYKDQKDKLVYQSHEISIKNMDERYKEAVSAAERIYDNIITEDMDADERIEKIHDYLVKSTIYDESAVYDEKQLTSVFKAAGALVDKNAVCSGYSRAFMILAQMAGVPAIYVASDGMNHGWNLVYGNKGWRYIDVTWDDPVPDRFDVADHRFLNMSIEEFSSEGSHIFDDDKPSSFYLSLAKSFFDKNE